MAAAGELTPPPARSPIAGLEVICLAAIAGALYLYGLSWAPIHLHFDEIRFGEHARSIAASLRDLNGRFLPVYFQIDGPIWFHPLGVYLPAIAFAVLPVSAATLRAPTAMIGVLDVVLLYLVARRVFGDRWLAMAAGALLTISPAHFIHSRMAVDYLFPTPFILGSVWLTLQFLQTRSPWAIVGAGGVLGLGIYSYIAAVALMPLWLAATIVLLCIERAGLRAVVLAIAGFLIPVVPAAIFIAAHPEMVASTLGRYGMTATNLDLFQRAREMLVPWVLSDRANLYGSFFLPGYLFVSGGGSLVGSTRTAGVLLLPVLPLILMGVREALLKWSPATFLILCGVVLPPLAASVVAEQFAVGRAIAMVPFLTLLAVYGAKALLESRAADGIAPLLASLAGLMLLVGTSYLGYRGLQGEISISALVIVVAAGIAGAIAYAVWRSGRLRSIAIALLCASAVQFAVFASDYLGDYRGRSAFWFNGNLKGAVTRIVEIVDAGSPPVTEVWLDDRIDSVDWYWSFHLAELKRSDLRPLSRKLARQDAASRTPASGTIYLISAADPDLKSVAQQLGMSLVAAVSDPNDEQSGLGPGEHAVYLLYRAP